MQSKEKDNLIFARLFPGEEIFESLEKVCRKYNIETAVILSGLGQLGEFELGFFKEKGNYLPEKFTEPHELLLLTGNVSLPARNASHSEAGGQDGQYEFHLHAVLGNKQKRAVGGHFIKGTVSVTGEIVLLKTDLKVRRETEETTGLKGLFLHE